MRAILHSDMNSYYASVEQMLNPSLRGKAIAVCGSTETRHGIVLAKSDKAKCCGVKTGMATWEAKQLCRDLIVVPPQYEQYTKYSLMAHEIYSRYTSLIEPFGMDECWLDVTGNTKKEPETIAQEIRKTMREELGLTVSIGVSFNKIFAKLGSDMKKPDAVTEISYDGFKEKIWPLAVSELLGVGRATMRKLLRYNIKTIGDLAKTDPTYLNAWFGVNGQRLWEYANGHDSSRVAPYGYKPPVKSVSHGMTCVGDLLNIDEVTKVLYGLAPKVSTQLRELGAQAKGLQLTVRDSGLEFFEYQCQMPYPTQCTREFVENAVKLLCQKYDWKKPIRAVSVRAINLIAEQNVLQLDLFGVQEKRTRYERLERAADDIRYRFGKDAITIAATMNTKLKKDTSHESVKMPNPMYV